MSFKSTLTHSEERGEVGVGKNESSDVGEMDVCGVRKRGKKPY